MRSKKQQAINQHIFDIYGLIYVEVLNSAAVEHKDALPRFCDRASLDMI